MLSSRYLKDENIIVPVVIFLDRLPNIKDCIRYLRYLYLNNGNYAFWHKIFEVLKLEYGYIYIHTFQSYTYLCSI